MLKIKLARFGKRNQPMYRIVVNEAKDKRDGKYVAQVGQYAPTQTPKILSLDIEAYRTWMTKGAQPTETVANLVRRFESGKSFPAKKKRLSEKARAKATAEQAAAKEAAEKPAEPAEETSAAPAAEPETSPEPTETAAE